MNENRDYNNYKPYRTKENKELARKLAEKGPDGHWHCSVPVSYHPVKKDLMRKTDAGS